MFLYVYSCTCVRVPTENRRVEFLWKWSYRQPQENCYGFLELNLCTLQSYALLPTDLSFQSFMCTLITISQGIDIFFFVIYKQSYVI